MVAQREPEYSLLDRVDNCAPFILELAQDDDITINLEYLMEFGKGEFLVYVINDDTIVHNMTELMKGCFRLFKRGY